MGPTASWMSWHLERDSSLEVIKCHKVEGSKVETIVLPLLLAPGGHFPFPWTGASWVGGPNRGTGWSIFPSFTHIM